MIDLDAKTEAEIWVRNPPDGKGSDRDQLLHKTLHKLSVALLAAHARVQELEQAALESNDAHERVDQLEKERDWFKKCAVENYDRGCVRAMERELLKIKDLEAALDLAIEAINKAHYCEGGYSCHLCHARYGTPAILKRQKELDAMEKCIVAAKCFYVQSSVLAEVLDELDAVRGEK